METLHRCPCYGTEPSNPTGDRFVDKQVDVEHDVQAYSVLRHDVDSSAADSPGAIRLECVEVLLQKVEMKGAV